MDRNDLTHHSAPARGEPWALELETLERQIELFRAGAIPPEKFKEYRLSNGIYGQKQEGVHMIRVKIPNGVLGADQLDALAEVAETHGHGIAHITTRQDIQYHFIPLEDVPAVLRILAQAGLHSREACGNSVRNVTSCPFSGICRDEPFPVLPYAQAAARFLLRHSAVQSLGRKFKIAFSGCASDCAAGAIHDIGAIAATKTDPQGRRLRGFRIIVGGGLGTVPFLAQTLVDFLPAEQILWLCEAIVRMFSAHGNRRNRSRARLKFVVDRWGIEEFRARFHETFDALAPRDRDDLQVSDYLYPEELAALAEPEETPQLSGNGDPAGATPWQPEQPDTQSLGEYGEWLVRNTRSQKLRGLRSVTINFVLGDMRPGDLRSLARSMRETGTQEARLTIEQNLVLQNVPEPKLPDLFERLRQRDLARAAGSTALDILSCPGADTCNLGITTSKGLAEEIGIELAKTDSRPSSSRTHRSRSRDVPMPAVSTTSETLDSTAWQDASTDANLRTTNSTSAVVSMRTERSWARGR